MPDISVYTRFENAALSHWECRRDVFVIEPKRSADSPDIWFYFLLSFVKERAITFHIPDLPAQALCPVSVSYDRVDWLPLNPLQQDGTSFRHLFRAADAIISATPPYTSGMLYDLTLWAGRSSHVRIDYLSTVAPPGTEPPTCITISDMGEGESAERPVIWVIARQHPLEAGSSWLAEGMVRFLLSKESTAQELRRRFVFKIVPLLDVMGQHYAATSGLTWPPDADGSRRECDGKGILPTQAVWDHIAAGPQPLVVINLRSHVLQAANSYYFSNPAAVTAVLHQSAAAQLARQITPWYTWGQCGRADGGYFSRFSAAYPATGIGEVGTSWYYGGHSVGNAEPVRKTQYELCQEGELVLRALAAAIGIDAQPAVPPLLMPRLTIGEGDDLGTAAVWCAADAADLEVFLAGEGLQERMPPTEQRSSYIRYALTVPNHVARHAERIVARTAGNERQITLVERRTRSCDSSLA